MRIMIHCGAGNSDRPRRWSTINKIFTDLGTSLHALGHDVYMMVDPAAVITAPPKCPIIRATRDTVDLNWIETINPDCGITWNGNSDGDRLFVDAIGKDKMIYGELGFFGHYDKNCYFDRCGVNTRHSIIGTELVRSPDDADICSELQSEYKKSRQWDRPFVFVPLQDEGDTQITQYSPFKTMDEFLHHVYDIYRFHDLDILYKVHPRANTTITLKAPRVFEVKKDVHHYLPYADQVFGLNSTVMVEALLYHSRIVTYGCGISSRHFVDEHERQAFIGEMYRRQMKWNELKCPDTVKDSHLYSLITALIA
jgi:hypothetical protein